VGTEHDPDRIEFIYDALRAAHRMIEDGLPVSSYICCSLLDNLEWWDGHRPKSGRVEVDRPAQERSVKPSGRWYGAVTAGNGLLIDPSRKSAAGQAPPGTAAAQ